MYIVIALPPKCKEIVLENDDLQIQCTNDNNCIFQCNGGGLLIGQKNIYCVKVEGKHEGQWSAEVPKCKCKNMFCNIYLYWTPGRVSHSIIMNAKNYNRYNICIYMLFVVLNQLVLLITQILI